MREKPGQRPAWQCLRDASIVAPLVSVLCACAVSSHFDLHTAHCSLPTSNDNRKQDTLMLRTAVIGVGHLGRQHARIHANLAAENLTEFVSVCDLNEQTAQAIAAERDVEWTTDWRELVGKVDAVSLAVPTESHCEIACGLLEAGVHVLVEKPIARTLAEADEMITAAAKSGALLQAGHLERFNPALVALRPHVRNPVYFEIHRVGEFTARSLDIDVVLDLMIHDLDIVQWLVGEDVEVTELHAVGIPILTNKVDAANARLRVLVGRSSQHHRFARGYGKDSQNAVLSTTRLRRG